MDWPLAAAAYNFVISETFGDYILWETQDIEQPCRL